MISGALGAVAPQPGQLPATVHYVHYEVTCGLRGYKHNDNPLGGQTEVVPLEAMPPRVEEPPLTEANVRGLIAPILRQLPPVGTSRVVQPI